MARLLRALLRLGQFLEAIGIGIVLGALWLLPLDWASALGGWIGRCIGPLLPVTRHAELNLRRAFPEKTRAEIRTLIIAMWDNLGRVFGESPHLGRFRFYEPGGQVEVIGAEYIDDLRDDGKPGIFFSAHLGNWEVAPLAAAQRGLPLARIYRAPNNPFVARLVRYARAGYPGELLPKGAEGARRALGIMRAGGHLAILVDQKMNNGIAVPFFGRPAMTAPALAQMAMRFSCPVVPTRIERLHGTRFRLTIYPPLVIERSGDRHRDVVTLMTRINAIVEGWVREQPDQWLWVHRRWPD